MTLKRIISLAVGLCAMESYAYDFVSGGMAFTVTDAAPAALLYDLQGRAYPDHLSTGRAAQPAKGLYISGSRKTLLQ